MAEFKISRLRFTWEGTWATDTFYNRDAVIEYNGKAYICLEPHTSGDFYEDIGHVNQLGASTPYWLLMADGKTWKGPWLPTTYYSLGNIVSYGGAVYECTLNHTSASVLDTGKFELYTAATKFYAAWTPSTAYGIGDTVKYGGIVYKCTVNHVSAETNMLGLENNIANWQVIYSGIDYKGVWTTNTRYKLNDIIKSGGSLWICTLGHLGSSSFNDTNWDIWVPGQEYSDIWDDTIAYQVGDVVRYGGYLYTNLVADNLNNTPTVDTAEWDLLSQGYNLIGEWDDSTQYQVGDTVTRGGYLFSSSTDNTAQDPTNGTVNTTYSASGSTATEINVASTEFVLPGMLIQASGFTQQQTVVLVTSPTSIIISSAADGELVDAQEISFVGINYENWTLAVPGISWKNRWVGSITQDETTVAVSYNIGDLVVWQNTTYICVSGHQASAENRPDLDTTYTNWQPYLYHARKNGMNTIADLETFNNDTYQAVPIGETDQVLRVVGRLPVWRKLHVVPNVYYVATTGQDRTDYGDTWDHPWKTIKYACDFVGAGTKNPNAKTILTDNKDFLTAEMYQWMLYQKSHTVAPFSPSSIFDQTATIRDAEYIIDAVIYDMTRDGNSQTVAATLAYFSLENKNSFVNQATADSMPYIIAALTRLGTLMSSILNNTPITPLYQGLNSVSNPVSQTFAVSDMPEPDSDLIVADLMNIVTSALTAESAAAVPPSNQGVSATIYIKTGTYDEILPITVPENVALNGDELRGVVVQPANPVNTYTTGVLSEVNKIKLKSYDNLEIDTPLQFTNLGINPIDGINPGQTYYVLEVDRDNGIKISEEPGGTEVDVAASTYGMTVYGGGVLFDMFRMRNGTGLRNMTLSGLRGTLTEANQFLTQRPTGGSFVSLDPGTGPDDTSTWIIRRSPYIQNVTTFGYGCTGLKIDGRLHNGGNRSIVANDFTQIIGDGIGVWVTGPNSLCELVSVFAYYGYAGYFAEDGARIRATNGNTSYGRYGVIAEGFDDTEVPVTGTVYNQSTQVQASVQSSFGSNATLLALQFANAGSGYTQTTTNLLKHSNNFLNSGNWSTGADVTIQENTIAPSGLSEAWTLTGVGYDANTQYVNQGIAIQSAGAFYSNVSASNVTGSGIGATFDITVTATEYLVSVNNPGSGYVELSELLIQGKTLGGQNNLNDCLLTITGLSGSAIQSVSVEGTVPSGSDKPYTLSIFAKQGTATSFQLSGSFINGAGPDSVSSINFNFETGIITPLLGSEPAQYGKIELPDGWYRVWMAIVDDSGLNDQLVYQINPTGTTGTPNYTYFYGAQLEVSSETYDPSFYLQTTDATHTAFANYNIVGAGTGAVLIGDEIRTKAVFQTRVTDPGSGAGGGGYLTASNAAQGGTDQFITIAASDVNLNSNYNRMRVFINSGTGAGQYGYISYYDTVSKNAQVLKESFDVVPVISSNSTSDKFTIGPSSSTDTLYIDQPVQFIPTYYTTDVLSIAYSQIQVTATLGGTVNTLTVPSTVYFRVNMPVTFTGDTFGGVTTNYTYYVSSIESDTTITISTLQFGTVWSLTTSSVDPGLMYINFPTNTGYIDGATVNMAPNMPIQFTGTANGGIAVGEIYYVNDIISSNKFSISTSLVTTEATSSEAATDTITVTSTVGMVMFNPVKFSGTTFGNVVEDTKYYIREVIDETTISIVDTLTTTIASATTEGSNLITVASTAGFIVDNPIMFVGTAFGDIETERTYYILVINDATSFTISATPGGSATSVATDVGNLIVKTFPAKKSLANGSGTMAVTTTGLKFDLDSGTCLMVGTYSTELFGGVTTGTTYYIKSIQSVDGTFTLTDTLGGSSTIALTTKTGSMNLGAVGWDHINVGTPIAPVLDSSSVYYIEPRTTYSAPEFDQTAFTGVSLAPGTSWVAAAYGENTWIALPSTTSTASKSEDGQVWTTVTLPISASWTDIAYGNGYWVAISSGGASNSKVLYSNSKGAGWRSANLPSASTWTDIAYGDGSFVAIDSSGNTAYSTNYGKTWSSGTALAELYAGMAYGNGTFVTVNTGGDLAAYSVDGGENWLTSTLPSTADWSAIAYGNGRFVAVSSTSANTAYSFDAITWYESNLPIAADFIEYGQGVFVAIKASSTTAYISEGGADWVPEPVTSATYGAIKFGYSAGDNVGLFVTLAETSAVTTITAGCRAKGRAVITSGVITSISQWEPGSGYLAAPTVTFTDPNVTTLATVTPRLGNGALGNPTFNNRGTGYSTASTQVTITGSGYADAFQTGLTIIVNNLTALPQPGDNLTIAGSSQIYKVTSATAAFGTTAPNIEANIQIAPDMSVALSPDNGATVTIRTKYSQVRLTGHDFLNVGYGNVTESNYPGLPADTVLAPQDQAVEVNYGRVFYTSTDQDGNFRVGGLFAVEQATGIVTLSASQFGLTGLETLSLGGIAVGGSGVVIRQFSTDSSFVANSNNIVPTQKAIKQYLVSRLSQGGSNTFTGQLIAGTVLVGGPDKIASTIPEGTRGSNVKMTDKVMVDGPGGAWAGDGAAMAFFMKSWNRR